MTMRTYAGWLLGEREVFEHWLHADAPNASLVRRNDRYESDTTQSLWLGWLARAEWAEHERRSLAA
jgi:hypothetical protein